MAYTSKQKSYVASYSADYLTANGLTRRDLFNSYAARQDYNNSLARYIASNPQIFDSDHIAAANIIRQPDAPLEDFDLGDAFSIFFVEVGDQAERINPFSSPNLNMTYLIGGVALITVAAVIAYKVTPKIPQK